MGYLGYNNHVSFDDLAPSFVDDEIRLIKQGNKHIGFNNKFIHVPPQYNPLYEKCRKFKKTTNSNPFTNDKYSLEFDDGSSTATSAKSRSQSPRKLASGSGGLETSIHGTSKSKLAIDPFKRLPPPPETSNLKKDTRPLVAQMPPIKDVDISNMDSDVENDIMELTKDNTQVNSGAKYRYTQSLFSNLNEVEDRIKQKPTHSNNDSNNASPRSDGKGRRKSFANMSLAELAALEDFYKSKSRSTHASPIDQFDFSQQKSFYSDNKSNNNNNAAIDKTNELINETLKATYPSRPVVNHRAISLTIQNNSFTDYVTAVQKMVPIKAIKERRSSLRVISCYISGRRFTWSSVDWYIENLAKDGDHVVIVTTIPNFEQNIEKSIYKEKRQQTKENEILKYKKSISGLNQNDNSSRLSLSLDDMPTRGARIEAIHCEAHKVGKSILRYYANRLRKRIVKITVEIIKTDSTKDALFRSASLYKPHAQIISTVSTNIQIKFKNGNVKLPFFMMKHYSMPTFVVPFEFIHPQKLIKDDHRKKEKTDQTAMIELLDEIICRTLNNPFLNPSTFSKFEKQPISTPSTKMTLPSIELTGPSMEIIEKSNEVFDPNVSGSDCESVTSVNEYFPIPSEVQKKIDLFNQIGYIVPPTSRRILLNENDAVYDKDGKKIYNDSQRSSRRTSRLQIGAESGIYKVKSLILDDDNLSDLDTVSTTSSSIRKVKSGGLHPTYSNRSAKKNGSTSMLTKSKTLETPTLHKSHHHHKKSKKKPVMVNDKIIPVAQSGSKIADNSNNASRSGGSGNSSKKKSKAKKSSGFGSMFGKLFK